VCSSDLGSESHEPLDQPVDLSRPNHELGTVADRIDEAATWIRNAALNGYADPAHMENDSDLDQVRQHAKYREAMRAIRVNRQDQFDEFKRWWDDRPLHVVLPEKEIDGAKPLVVVLHGYGGDGPDIAEAWREAADVFGAIVVAPESGRPIDGRHGYQWSHEDEAEWVILRAIERMKTAHEIDDEQIVLTGFSQGAFASLRFGLKYPEKLVGVIPVAGIYREDLTPFNRFKKDEPLPKFFLMIGSEDRSVESMSEAKTALEARDAKVELVVYKGLGHEFPKNRDEETLRALRFVLGISDESAHGIPSLSN